MKIMLARVCSIYVEGRQVVGQRHANIQSPPLTYGSCLCTSGDMYMALPVSPAEGKEGEVRKIGRRWRAQK